MKARVLTKINALIAFLMGILGFHSCIGVEKYGTPISMYGTPYAELQATGRVTNEQNEPVRNVRVAVKEIYGAEGYTGEDGTYTIGGTQDFPSDSLSIVVTDTAGVYESEWARVKADYDLSDRSQHDGFYEGTARIYQDFQLKKK